MKHKEKKLIKINILKEEGDFIYFSGEIESNYLNGLIYDQKSIVNVVASKWDFIEHGVYDKINNITSFLVKKKKRIINAVSSKDNFEDTMLSTGKTLFRSGMNLSIAAIIAFGSITNVAAQPIYDAPNQKTLQMLEYSMEREGVLSDFIKEVKIQDSKQGSYDKIIRTALKLSKKKVEKAVMTIYNGSSERSVKDINIAYSLNGYQESMYMSPTSTDIQLASEGNGGMEAFFSDLDIYPIKSQLEAKDFNDFSKNGVIVVGYDQEILDYVLENQTNKEVLNDFETYSKSILSHEMIHLKGGGEYSAIVNIADFGTFKDATFNKLIEKASVNSGFSEQEMVERTASYDNVINKVFASSDNYQEAVETFNNELDRQNQNPEAIKLTSDRGLNAVNSKIVSVYEYQQILTKGGVPMISYDFHKSHSDLINDFHPLVGDIHNVLLSVLESDNLSNDFDGVSEAFFEELVLRTGSDIVMDSYLEGDLEAFELLKEEMRDGYDLFVKTVKEKSERLKNNQNLTMADLRGDVDFSLIDNGYRESVGLKTKLPTNYGVNVKSEQASSSSNEIFSILKNKMTKF